MAVQKYDAPAPGELDQEVVLDVTVRVTLRGKRDVIEAEVRRRFELELPMQFPNAEILDIHRAPPLSVASFPPTG